MRTGKSTHLFQLLYFTKADHFAILILLASILLYQSNASALSSEHHRSSLLSNPYLPPICFSSSPSVLKYVTLTIKSNTTLQMCQLQLGKASKEHPQSFVFYDHEQLSHQRCNICWLNQEPLIEPCLCGSKYHQLCLLRMVKEKMLGMRDKGKIEMSELKCRKCKTLFRLLIQQNTYYSCHYFCLDLKRDWTNKTAIFGLALILLIIIGLAIIIHNYSVQDGPIFYALLFAETMLTLMFVVCLVIFGQSNFTYKQLVLMEVYEFSEFMRKNNTSSDGESPQHHIITDHFEIAINGLS